MPLYGFHCAECDKDSELLLRFSDVPVCPACGSEKMERSVSRMAAGTQIRRDQEIMAGAGQARRRFEQFQQVGN